MANMNDKVLITETITRLFHALDARDWQTIYAVGTDSVDVNYPSKPGGLETLSIDDFVSGLKGFLPGFDSTQHLLGPIVVEMENENEAIARFHARVTHVLNDRTNDPIWVIGCHYTFGLERQDDTWKICSSRVNVSYQEGNSDLEKARGRKQAIYNI